MEKVCVFIDGGYLDEISKNVGYIKIDYLKFSRKLCGENHFVRAYYYHCLPYQSDPPSEEEIKRFSQANSFFEKLKRLDRFEVRLGKLVKRGCRSDGSPIFNQKRVDVFLATDLVKFSARKVMDQAVLITSDSDYVPAIVAAKEFGVIIKLAHSIDLPINHELVEACDEKQVLEKDFFNDIKRL